MPVLNKPATFYPDHLVRDNDIISFIKQYHPESPYIDVASKMIKNSTIEKRHLFVSFAELMKINGFAERQEIHAEVTKAHVVAVAKQALLNANLSKDNISMVIVTSCTGFMMPSLTAFLINALNLSVNTVQLPVAQMGCVAGAYAINRAYDHCLMSKDHNALIVCVETSSMCFHRGAAQLEDFISDAIFGDGIAGCVMRGDDQGEGLRIEDTHTLFLKNSESFIQYNLIEHGFSFSLDKQVMHSIEMIAEPMNTYLNRWFEPNELKFCISHTGGRRILDEVSRCFGIPNEYLIPSRESLRSAGNTSSVSVIDVFARHFGRLQTGQRGVLMAFGPGFTTEVCVGVWQNGQQ